VSWRQLDGPKLAELAVTEGGFRLRARTLPLETLHPDPLPYGIVPIAPRTQGRYVLEAEWQGDGASAVYRTVTITSIARATGLPSLSVSQEVLLGGAGWHVRRAPRGGKAEVRTRGVLSLFEPDAPGRWWLEDGNAREFTILASWHDKTPLDCGRSECHAAIADAVTATPMSHALERAIEAARSPSSSITCLSSAMSRVNVGSTTAASPT